MVLGRPVHAVREAPLTSPSPRARPLRVGHPRVTMSGELRRSLPAISAAVPVVIVYFAVLGIVLAAAGPKRARSRRRADERVDRPAGRLADAPRAGARDPLPAAVAADREHLRDHLLRHARWPTTFTELAGAAIVAGAILLPTRAARRHRPDRRVDPADRAGADRRGGAPVRGERVRPSAPLNTGTSCRSTCR